MFIPKAQTIQHKLIGKANIQAYQTWQKVWEIFPDLPENGLCICGEAEWELIYPRIVESATFRATLIDGGVEYTASSDTTNSSSEWESYIECNSCYTCYKTPEFEWH